MSRKALITGVTGQDGAYLAKYLLDLDYRVIGTFRRTSTTDFWRLAYLDLLDHNGLELVEMDITDPGDCIRKLVEFNPEELYNLAAQSFVGTSFSQPALTSNITGLAVLNLLEAIRIVNPEIRYYQASTSEMFGKVENFPQDERTGFYPRSPYGVAKLYAHWMTVNYREAYGIFASSGILFNHESPLRGREFVTRKITESVARIKTGRQTCLYLGNLDAHRDWGYAKEYVEGMHLMLQHDVADNFVLATGRSHSVKEFVQLAFDFAGIAIDWQGENESCHAVRRDNGKTVVSVDKTYYRPAEVDSLVGSALKAKKELGWTPRVSLEELCELMLRADLDRQDKAAL